MERNIWAGSRTGNLDGKVTIVTGAGRGLGRAMTLGLLDAGARVAAVELEETQDAVEEVAVCGQRYVFNPVLADDLDTRAPCPPGIADAQHPTQLAPAVASQSDLMAYQNDDPIARKIEESFRGVH